MKKYAKNKKNCLTFYKPALTNVSKKTLFQVRKNLLFVPASFSYNGTGPLKRLKLDGWADGPTACQTQRAIKYILQSC